MTMHVLLTNMTKKNSKTKWRIR